MNKHYLISLSQIPQTAEVLAKQLRGGEILALIGNLGSGKTTFTQALAKHLKIKNRVTSPTFVIMNIFPGILPRNKKMVSLVHLDLYRTKSFNEINALGLTELWHKKDIITVIEWADKIKTRLPKNIIKINFHG